MSNRYLIHWALCICALGLVMDRSANAATIVSVVANGGQQDLEGDTFPDGDPSTWGRGDDPGMPADIDRDVIQDALNSGASVTILSELDILVQDPVEKTVPGPGLLVLEADRNILINAAISVVSDDLSLTAIGDVTISAPISADGLAIKADGITRIQLGGALRGNATVIGNAKVDGGKVAPGDSPGIFDVSGNLDVTSGSILEIEVGGLLDNDYDRFLVGGTATLGGTIEAGLINGFVPTVGDTFDVVLASGINDMGVAVTGPFTKSLVSLGGQDALRLTYVPEPGSILLLTGTGLALLRRV